MGPIFAGVFAIAALVGVAAGICALGEFIDKLSKGKGGFGAFHVLAWLPAIGIGILAWRDPAAFGHYAWVYMPLVVASVVYAVAFAYAAFWAGLPLFWVQRAIAWLRSRKDA